MQHTPLRILGICAAAALLCTACPQARFPFAAYAAETPASEFEYYDSDYGDGIQIAGWSGSGTSVTVPSEIDGRTVTAIGQSAFQDCTGLKEITLPDGISLIGRSAFSGCTSLAAVTLPQRLSTLSDYAFESCTALNEIVIPQNVTELRPHLFSGCTGLTAVTLGKNIRRISDSTFEGCTNLTIHGYFGSYAAEYAENHGIPFEAADRTLSGTFGAHFTWSLSEERTLTVSGTGEMPSVDDAEYPWYESRAGIHRIVLSEGVTSVGSGAFYGCSAAESVSLPDGLTVIGDNAFAGCYALTELHIPDSVTKIEWNAFASCSALTAVQLPDSVTELGGSVFNGCRKLESANLPGGLRSVSNNVFSGCPITEITIPEQAQYIGASAFSGCRLTAVTIPDAVRSIGSDAFAGCPLTEVTVPAHVEKISGGAFRSSTLTDITILNPACEIFDDSSVFGTQTVIHGYAGSTAEAYAAAYSRKFAEIAPPAGDCSGDGRITAADAVLLARFAAEDGTLTEEQTALILRASPDRNGDGLVTAADVIALLKQAASGDADGLPVLHDIRI